MFHNFVVKRLNMVVTFAQASSFFVENPDLFAEFVLKRLNNSEKSKLLTLLEEDLLKSVGASRGSLDSKDSPSKFVTD